MIKIESHVQPHSLLREDPQAQNNLALRKAAKALEASFLAEMLKSAGVGKSSEHFGGGAGEDGFASFLVTAQAEHMVKAGGLGLAERIYQSLMREA